MNSDTDLINAIASVGYAVPRKGIVWDSKLHRFATDAERPYSKDGWYVAFDDALGQAAAFGSWRDDSKHVWSNGTGRQISDTERAEIERQKKARRDEEKKAHDLAATRAKRIYEQADQSVAYSGYLQRKGIECPDGVRAVSNVPMKAFGFDSGWPFHGLVVPLYNAGDDLRSLQLISDNPNQKKLFMKGSETENCFHTLGDIKDAPVIAVAEGLATAQSVRQATGWPVLVAFSAGNLPAVVAMVRKRNATAEIVICTDDDPAGHRNAQRATQAVTQARTVIPGQGCNDFNDLHAAHGLKAVHEAIIGAEEQDDDDDESWRADLIIKMKDDGTQTIPCRVHNLMLILKHAPEFRGRIRLNQFSAQVSVDDEDAEDIAAVYLKAIIEKAWIRDKIPTGDIHEAMAAVAHQQVFHPIMSYLDNLQWDGIERIPDFFSDFAGCPKDDYHIAVALSLFISAVARIYKPGCKVDTMVILQSAQGMRKTSLWIALFGKWCAEVTSSLNDKDFFSGLRGVWCADFGELDQFSRAESTRIKQVITQTFDHYRPHYGRQHQRFPRQCIFVGGTNASEWQGDSTGGRRFLPVNVCEKINVDAVADIRDQLFAEAKVRFERGEKWWDIPDSEEHQESIYVGDTWEDIIQGWLFCRYVDHTIMQGTFQFQLSEVLRLALEIEPAKQGKPEQTRAGRAMRRLGWAVERKRLAKGERPTRVYVPSREWLEAAERLRRQNKGETVPT